MRVLQINANYGFGSTGLIVKDISDMLTQEGYESFCAYQKSSERISSGYQIGKPIDWKIHAVLCRIFGRQGYYSSLATKKLLLYIDSIKPDIVHLHNLHSNYINISILLHYLAENDIATVITMHDCWYFTGKCFHYADCDCDGFTHGCGNCKKKSAPPRSYLFDWSAWSLKNKNELLHSIPRLKIVGCSEWICKEAKRSFLEDCNISCIYNGVNTEIFRPSKSNVRKKYGLKEDTLLVMGMANKWLLPSNINIIDAFHDLTGVTLMIVGCTESQMLLLQKYGEKVVGIGFINDRETLAEIYSAADVFINLTHADTLPTVNMESICCGTPVITYDSCGSPELVSEGTGIIVKEGDKAGIIEAIKCISKLNRELCRKKGLEDFDKTNCYKKYIEIYQQLEIGAVR